MKFLLSLLLLLVPSIALAEIELIAPDTCVVGQLVVLDASASLSDEIKWEVVPATPDFKVFGKQACFSGRAAGEYLVILAGVEEGRPVLRTHTLTVEGGMVSSDLTGQMKEWAESVASENRAEEALRFAQSFRALAGAKIPVEQIIEATADANRRALGDSLDAWKPFLDRLGNYLNRLALDGKLNSPDAYQEVWIRVADSIEECFQ